ncbi:MAG: Phosphatidylcholine synthase, partial [uncultured Blastococcus sp.]
VAASSRAGERGSAGDTGRDGDGGRPRPGWDVPVATAAGRGRRPPLHRQRGGPRVAHRARGDRRPGGHRPVAGAGDPVRRRHRRHAGPPLPGQGDDPLVRRCTDGRHRRLPHLCLRGRRPALDHRPAALGRVGLGAGHPPAAGLLLPVLPGRREDRRPLLPRVPELLERRRLLRDRAGRRHHRRRRHARRPDRPRLRAGQVRLPLAHEAAAHPEPRPGRRLADQLGRAARPVPRPAPGGGRAEPGLPRLLLRRQHLAHRRGHPPPVVSRGRRARRL